MRIPLSKTIIRNSIWISSAFFSFLVIFNILIYIVIKYQLTSVLDAKIRHEIEHIVSSFKVKDRAIEIIRPEEFLESDLVRITDNTFFLQVYSNEGKILLGSENLKYFNQIPLAYPEFTDHEYFEDSETKSEVVRTGYTKLIDDEGQHIGYVQLSFRREKLVAALKSILSYTLLILPFVFVITIAVSIYISRRLIQPINKIIETANNISAVNLKERLQLDSDPNDEINKLKLTLNNLFERLEVQIQQISAFSDNASHQLMTPLTAISSELEFALMKKEYQGEMKQSLEVVKEQSDRMISIVKSLLLISRTSRDSYQNCMIFNLTALFEKQIKIIFPQKRIYYFIANNLYIRGKEENFAIVIENLIGNALKYSAEDEIIEVISNSSNGFVNVIVKDKGIGISDFEKEKVFERFYRSESVEKIGIKGYGLGLSIIKSIVISMNGRIQVSDNSPKGAIFSITLPYIKVEE